MPEYLAPGVYIQEVNAGTRPIEGVGTAMAAFIGFAPAGPTNTPVLVTNWSQYVDTFGAGSNGGRRNPHLDNAYLSHAVYGYFNNGGGRCYVVRVDAAKGNGK
jgi:phage tail sheath protein FI